MRPVPNPSGQLEKSPLPTDIKRHIASFLDPKSATRFSMVSKDHEYDLKNQFEPNGVCKLCNVRLDSKGNCMTEADMAEIIRLESRLKKMEAHVEDLKDDYDEATSSGGYTYIDPVDVKIDIMYAKAEVDDLHDELISRTRCKRRREFLREAHPSAYRWDPDDSA